LSIQYQLKNKLKLENLIQKLLKRKSLRKSDIDSIIETSLFLSKNADFDVVHAIYLSAGKTYDNFFQNKDERNPRNIIKREEFQYFVLIRYLFDKYKNEKR